MDVQQEVTGLLSALQTRDGGSDGRAEFDRLLVLVYDELRAMAHRQLRRERPGHTLGTTALVHEAYLKLVDGSRLELHGRAQFLAVAAGAMRHILVDYARSHAAAKRGGGRPRLPLHEALLGDGAFDDALAAADARADDLVALDDALTRLGELDARASHVVECRFFGGLSEAEIAEALGVTTRTVRRDWAAARAWLQRALEP
jgi:RNA polymerase sigma factor (TIGR02999 family)